jgi:polyketide cyclase/dehydrase/lipid transport protein
MGRVAAVHDVAGPLGAAERLWYDTARWPAFIDGFAHVVKVEGPWPGTGSRVVWDSTPAGRGRVVERVIDHHPGVGQALEVEDPTLRATQRVRFEQLQDGTAVGLELDYELKRRGPVRALVDLLFVRRAIRDSLRRTLARFSREVSMDLELLR